MDSVVLDTDIASLIYRRRLPATLAVRLAGRVLCVSFVTVAEMTMWSEVRHWSPRSQAGLARFLSGLVRLPYDEDVAVGWGRIQGAAVLRGRRRPANDTWVAAACLAHGLPLATRNVRDFRDFAEHNGLVLVTE
ncbi:MAG: type II toxin-antitoxin system VapC family toxin [Gaiellaceae bacterium]